MVAGSTADETVAIDEEPQSSLGCQSNADPRSTRHTKVVGSDARFDPQLLAVAKVDPIERFVDSQGLAEPRRSSTPIARWMPRSAVLHLVQTPQRFEGADQHRAAPTGLLGNRVEAVFGVDRINVKRARLGEHRAIFGPRPPMAVGGRVIAAQISFGLHNDPAPALPAAGAYQALAEQRAGDFSGRPIVERTIERLGAGRLFEHGSAGERM